LSYCPICQQPLLGDDIYCGSCGTVLPGRTTASLPARPTGIEQSSICPNGHMNDFGARFCETCGTPIRSNVPFVPSEPKANLPQPTLQEIPQSVGLIVMPDHEETTLPQTRRIFGRSDLRKYVKPEETREISKAHFTITQENGVFYLQDGGPDPRDPQVWKPSVNHTSINGVILSAGTKQRLNPNDVIDVGQLGLNLIFKTR
jgi:hypothetical protein